MVLADRFFLRWNNPSLVGAGLPALSRAFALPSRLLSSPAPASRRLPRMADHCGRGRRLEAGSNLL